MSTVNKSSQNEPLEKTGRRWVVGANAAFFILTSIYFFVAFLIVFFEFNGTDNYSFLRYVRDSIPSIVPTANLSSLQKPAETVLVFAWAWSVIGFSLIIMFTRFLRAVSAIDLKEKVRVSNVITSIWLFRIVVLTLSVGAIYVFYIDIPDDSGRYGKVAYSLIISSRYGVVLHGFTVTLCVFLSCIGLYFFVLDLIKMMRKGN